MTLAELADYVCLKVRHTDADSIAAAKEFLKARWRLIWDEQLWRESLTIQNVSITPSTNDLHAEGIVIMPEIIETIVALRSTDRALPVTHNEELFQTSSDLLNDSGDVTTYALMTPVIGQALDYSTIYGFFTDVADNGVSIRIRYMFQGLYVKDITQAALVSDETLASGEASFSIGGPAEVFELSKPETTSALILSNKEYVNQVAYTDSFYSVVFPTQTAATQRQRIRLLTKPTTDLTLRVLGKRRFMPLDDDADHAVMRWVDNCLLAFAQGDMLERDRQYGKAQAKFTEAVQLLDQARRVQVHQQAFVPRLVPECEPVEAVDSTYWLE